MNEQQHNDETEEVKPDVETLDFSKPSFSFVPKTRHIWRQEGFYLICRTGCELEHAIFIGPNKIMTGETEEGKPILTARV